MKYRELQAWRGAKHRPNELQHVLEHLRRRVMAIDVVARIRGNIYREVGCVRVERLRIRRDASMRTSGRNGVAVAVAEWEILSNSHL